MRSKNNSQDTEGVLSGLHFLKLRQDLTYQIAQTGPELTISWPQSSEELELQGCTTQINFTF